MPSGISPRLVCWPAQVMTIDKSSPGRGNSARLGARTVVDGGTPVEHWIGWDFRFASLALKDCPGLAIVAPHPDDETLGLGATAAMLCAAGVDVQVVSVSDGGAAYPGLDADRRTELETVRRDELRSAVAILGAREPIRLGLPDGELHRYERQLSDLLTEVLAGFPAGTWCAATWRGDGHPDHETVGRVTADVAHASGACFIEYPVWMWHWATPGDTAVPWERARRVPLTDEARAAKRRATQCFTSQTQPTTNGHPVLPPFVVDRLLAVGEVVFI